MLIQGKNNYNIEHDEAGTWKIKIKQGQELLTDEIKKGLEDFKEIIFFNDLSAKHWFFDYKINDVWIEGLKVDCNKMIIDINKIFTRNLPRKQESKNN